MFKHKVVQFWCHQSDLSQALAFSRYNLHSILFTTMLLLLWMLWKPTSRNDLFLALWSVYVGTFLCSLEVVLLL